MTPSRTVVTARPLRQDAARNRRQLLVAARSVFGHDGLDSGVETVARKAGVGTGTLYRHFPSKDDLVAALVDDLAEDVMRSAHDALARGDGQGLWEFLHATGAIQADNQGLLCRLWVNPPPAKLASIRELIAELVADAHRHQTLPPDVEQPDIIFLLQGLRGVIEANSSTRDGRSDAWERYLELATKGIRTPGIAPA